MTSSEMIKTGAASAILAAICCAGPLLVAALGTAGLTVWLTNSVYVLIPVLLICLALVGLDLYRRRGAAQACCGLAAPKQGTKS